MIFLEIHNRALEELLLMKFEHARSGQKHEKFAHTLADFDGAIYRMRTISNDKSKLVVSLTLNFFKQLVEFGVDELLAREYGPYLCSEAEPGTSVSLQFDLDQTPDNYCQLARQVAFLKRNCFASLFERFFHFHTLCEETNETKRAVIQYRPDETLFIQAQADRVTVIFSTVFKDPDDVIVSKVFMQELTEVRRRIDRAPQVLYSHSSPPSELQGTTAAVGDNVAYLSFVLFPRHLSATAAPRTINLIHSLRNYLHYHIKCAKGYIHRRMRAKTSEFIKILNRAHPQLTAMPVIHIRGGGLPVTRLPSFASFPVLSNGTEDEEEHVCEKVVNGYMNGRDTPVVVSTPPPIADRGNLNGFV